MKRKILFKLSMFSLSLLSIVYFFHILIPKLGAFPSITWSPFLYFCFLICILLYIGTMLIGGFNWGILLKDFGNFIKYAEAVKIVAFTQFGKYLPGNFGHHIGRFYIANRNGIPSVIVIQTIFYETIILLATSLLIGSLGFIQSYSHHEEFWIRLSLIVLFIFASLILPPKLTPWFNGLKSKWISKIRGNTNLKTINISTILKIAALNAISLSLSGIMLYIIAKFIFDVKQNDVFFLISAYTSSWLLGYIIPGAPAGMGIREATLVTTLSLNYSQEIAIALTITLRAISLIGDGICFAFSLFYRKQISFPKE